MNVYNPKAQEQCMTLYHWINAFWHIFSSTVAISKCMKAGPHPLHILLTYCSPILTLFQYYLVYGILGSCGSVTFALDSQLR